MKHWSLHNADAEYILSAIAPGSIDLVITSPPYNLGKSYEASQPLETYLADQAVLIESFRRILSNKGSVCWQVGNYVQQGEIFPLDIFYYPIFKKYGFKLRNRIIWHFGHGLHTRKRFSGRYESLLWFTKTDNYTFNLDPVRVPSKYPGKKHYKGPKKGQLSGNPAGKNPSDVWEIVVQDWENELWEIPNVKNNHPEKTLHPCQFPVELAERCVLALSNEGDCVYDPFAGVGSTLIAALMHERRAIGSERSKAYCEIAIDRIQALAEGTLKVRPLGRPIYTP